MKHRSIVALFAAMLAVLALVGLPVARLHAAGTTYYSQGSLAPNLTTSWNTIRGGGGAQPVTFTGGDAFVIQNGHSMTTSATWSMSGTGSKLQIENGGALTATSAVTLATGTTFRIDAGGTYVHNNTAAYGLTIFQGAEVFAAASTVVLNNSNTIGPSSVTFGNLTVNFTSDPGGSINCSGGLTTINGNLTIQSTSAREFRLVASSPANPMITIAGDVNISGGILNLSGGTAAPSVNIGGNFIQTGGTFMPGAAGAVTFTGPNQTLSKGAAGAVATGIFCNLTIAPGAALDTGEDLVAVAGGGACGALTQNGALVRTSLGQSVTNGGAAVTFVDARSANAAIVTQTAGADMGSTTVRTVSNQLPPACNGMTFGPLSKPLKRWYDITPAVNTGGAATVRLYFRTASPDERDGANAAAVEIFHCEPAGWRKLAGAYARGSDGSGSYVELPGVTGFSRFALAEPAPLAVMLDSMAATHTPAAGAIAVTWATAQEIDNRGFNQWRGVSPDGPDLLLNDAIIPSHAPGSALGASYIVTDTRDLLPGTTYFYWLEDVSLGGAVTRHEPVGVTYAAPAAVTLRSLRARPASGLEVTTYVTITIVAALALAGLADAACATVRRRK